MRGKVKRALALLIGCLTAALLGGATGALAMDSTTYTVTYGAQYNSMGMFVRIQDAFVPVGTYLTSVGLSAPEDMCLYEGSLYIADSGNGRIIVYELASGKVESFGEDVLKGPTGIWLDGGGNIYVADYRAEEVVIFGPDRRELRRLGKPQESYYGSSPYKPKKVAVNDFGTIFVVSEGTSEGILQFNADGSFNGFFGANTTGKLSLIEWFQKIFYTEEQKDRMLLRTPPPIVSLDIAEDNMVFSVSQTGDDFNSIKRLNLAGTNTFAESNYTRPDYVDVSVTENGSYYAVTSNGYIDEYSSEGVFLYQFGGRASNSDRNGVMTVVSAVESDEDGNIYLLDKERGLIQVWSPTDFADLVNSANSAYNAGSYEESLAAWGEVLRMSQNTYMANVGCADSLFQLMRYEEAAEYYKLCGERERYSDCFWEMRSEWMRRNIEWVLLAVLILFAIGLADHFARRRWAYHEYVSEAVDGFKGRHPLVDGRLVHGAAPHRRGLLHKAEGQGQLCGGKHTLCHRLCREHGLQGPDLLRLRRRLLDRQQPLSRGAHTAGPGGAVPRRHLPHQRHKRGQGHLQTDVRHTRLLSDGLHSALALHGRAVLPAHLDGSLHVRPALRADPGLYGRAGVHLDTRDEHVYHTQNHNQCAADAVFHGHGHHRRGRAVHPLA